MISNVLVLLLIQGIALAHATHLGDLKELCKGGSKSIKTISDLKDLVNAVNDVVPPQTTGCPDHVKAALLEMGRIADDRNACTMKKAQDLDTFVANYLRTGPASESQDGKNLPKPLVNFAIAYGMQVSNICMKRMIYTFSYKAYYKLLSLGLEDFQLVRRIAHKNSPIDRMLAPVAKNGEILLPSDMFAALPGLAKRVSLHLAKRDPLKQLAEICKKKLQPIYEPILMPISILTRLGFTYRDFWLRKDDFLNGKVLDKRGRFWSSVVFFCESIKTVTLVERDADPSHESIDIELEVSRAERGQSQCIADGQRTGESNELHEREPAEDVKQFPGKFSVPDRLVGNKIMPGHLDYSLKAKINSFDFNGNAVERIQARILRRSLRIFKSVFKLGYYKPLLEKVVRSLNFRRDPNDAELDEAFQEARESLLTLIDSDESVKSTYLVRAGGLVAEVARSPFKIALELLRFVSSYTLTVTFMKCFVDRRKAIDYGNKFEDIY